MIKNLIATICIGFALCQWVIIGERTIHALWMWRKFEGFGSGGYTTMNLETVVTGYTVSLLGIAVAVYARRRSTGSEISSKMLKTAAIIMAGGLVWLSLLIVSPLAVVVKQ